MAQVILYISMSASPYIYGIVRGSQSTSSRL